MCGRAPIQRILKHRKIGTKVTIRETETKDVFKTVLKLTSAHQLFELKYFFYVINEPRDLVVEYKRKVFFLFGFLITCRHNQFMSADQGILLVI